MTESGDRSRVLTLVFTDLADSTALKTQRGDIAVGELISRHREHVTRLAEDSAGRVIDWAGDGCFLTFETSSAAVMFALQLEQVHAEESDLPGVRIGIHMGEVTEKSGPGDAPRIEGLAVDIAARISGLARPGQVLMSASVHNSARQRLGVETFGQPILWQAHGTYELKGFDEPMDIREAGVEGIAPLEAPAASEKAKLIQRAKRKPGARRSLSTRPGIPIWAIGFILVLLVAVVFLLTRLSGSGDDSGPGSVDIDSLGPITSLAVLPLDNLTNDDEQDIFADGMMEAIIAELVKINALKVSPRMSVMHYKDTTKTMTEIAEELGVVGIIEGSVRREGEEVQVRVQLSHGPTEAYIWSGTYTETLTSVFKLQSDIALAIAAEIKVTITPDEKERVATSREVVPEAYNAYLLGEHYVNQSVTTEGLDQALRYFEKATELDPTFAEAWAGIGKTHYLSTVWAGGAPQQHYAAARSAARKALEHDPDSAMAHALLGVIAQASDWDWEEADRRTRRSIELAPGDFRVHRWRTFTLIYAGRWAEARQEIVAIEELVPRTFDKAFGGIFSAIGPFNRAIDAMESVLRDDSSDEQALNNLVQTYRNAGKHREALETADRYIEITRGSVAARTAKMRALAAAGQESEARTLIQEITTESGIEYDPSDVAEALVMLGDLDGAFEWYEKAASERRPDVLNIRNVAAGYRLFKSEHTERFGQDPRYWDLVERIGFPPLSPEHPGYANEQAHLARKAAEEEASAPIRKIAVLPFENLSSDPEQEYFVDGMTEALIAELAKIKSLKVISRTSVMRYKDTDKSLTEIARELGVDGIVEGSVLKAGDSVRITAQLIHGLTDEHLWSASRTAPLEDILKLQAEVALSMTDEIGAVVTPEERSRIASAPTVDARAYELYIQGRTLWSERTTEGFKAAIDRYQRALEIDPDFALAHLGLADTYLQQVDYFLVTPIPAYERARQEIERAFELGDPSGEAYASRARYRWMHDQDWEASMADFERAIELYPANPTAHLWYSIVLGARGRDDDMQRELETAVELDPFSPVIVGFHLQHLNRFGFTEEAVQRAEEIAREFPESTRIAHSLAFTYMDLGKCGDAIAEARRHYDLRGGDLMASLVLALVLAKCGDNDAARAQIEASEPTALERQNGAIFIAEVYALLEEPDRSIEWIENTIEWRASGLSALNSDKEFESLYDDPRFQDILRRLDLPDPRTSN